MKTTFYKKQGRNYIPVLEYDSELTDSYPAGSHLVVCRPGHTLRKFNIEPNYAALIAAGVVATDAISKRLMKASDLRPSRTPLTPEQLDAWENLSIAFGEENHALQWPAAREAAEEAVQTMIEEAKKLMEHESVKKAFDHFILMCKLTSKTTA